MRTVQLVVVVAVSCLAAGPVGGTPGGELRILELGPASFAASDRRTDYAIEQGGLGQLCVRKGAGYFVAALPLHADAVVEEMTMLVTDLDPQTMAMMSLAWRWPGGFEIAAMTPISTGEEVFEELTASGLSVRADPERHKALVLQVLLTGPGVCMHGARVKYRLG